MAMTTKYVSTTGAGAHDGSSEANAFSITEMATDINAGGKAGTEYAVKQGTYSIGASITLTGDGSTTAPILIRGYKTTPGDATLGRSSSGALDTSNMPTLSFGTGYGLDWTGSDYIIFESIKFTGSNSGYWLRPGNQCKLVNCDIANADTGGNIALLVNTSNTGVVDCDIYSAGTAQALNIGVGTCYAHGCRIKCAGSGGVGLQIDQTATAVDCVVYECGSHGISVPSTGTSVNLFNNTVVSCGGDGVRLANGTTGNPRVIGNHITDNGGYGINYQTSTCAKMDSHNRLRDNASGASNGGGDWVTAQASRTVTTDTGGASTDYADQPNDNYALVKTAAGFQVGPGWKNNIGACGTPSSAAGSKGYAAA